MSHMQTLELFAGTQSFSVVADRRGHKTYTVEKEASIDGVAPDECIDIMDFDPAPWENKVDFLGGGAWTGCMRVNRS